MKRLQALLLLAGLPGLAAAQSAQNQATAQRVFDEIFNQSRFNIASQIYAPDFVNHGLHKDAGLAEDQAAVRWEKKACPDLRIVVDRMTSDQDTVTVIWTARGTHTGRVGWIPPTGAHIEVRGITVWRFAGGRIREEWTSFDRLSLLREVAYHLKWIEIAVVVLLLLLDWGLSRLTGKLWKMVREPANLPPPPTSAS
jgi:steroid delta-isomerase-like uncharacterized protein